MTYVWTNYYYTAYGCSKGFRKDENCAFDSSVSRAPAKESTTTAGPVFSTMFGTVASCVNVNVGRKSPELNNWTYWTLLLKDLYCCKDLKNEFTLLYWTYCNVICCCKDLKNEFVWMNFFDYYVSIACRHIVRYANELTYSMGELYGLFMFYSPVDRADVATTLPPSIHYMEFLWSYTHVQSSYNYFYTVMTILQSKIVVWTMNEGSYACTFEKYMYIYQHRS